MAPTQTLTMPAPVQQQLTPYRRMRAKSVSKVWTVVEPTLLEQDEGDESSIATVFSRPTAKGLQQRPSTSPSAGSGESLTSPPLAAPSSVEQNWQQLEPLSKHISKAAQLAVRTEHVEITADSTPVRSMLDGSVTAPITPPHAVSPPPFDTLHACKGREEQLLREDETARWAEDVARVEAEAGRVPAEKEKQRFAGRIPPQMVPSPPPSLHSNKAKSPALGIFNILSRGRKSNAASLSPTASSMRSSTDISNADSLDSALLPKAFIEPAGKSIVPQTDAPVSASNGAERELSVRCRGVTVNLTVGSDTNALDILTSCSAKVTTPINTSNSAVVEMYNQLGLERRVRPYERIRDILNSWDQNSRNCLVVVHSDPTGNDEDLDSDVSPTGQGSRGFVLQLYHSQQPRRWNKRYMTLLDNGQILSSKKPDPNPADKKDAVALCHLSDFDVYTPTESQTKQLKPPRKYCFAIKSQQRATVFVNSQNFVHFFCTDDPDLAYTFHSLVRGWRSQYLASHVDLIEEKKRSSGSEKPPQIVIPTNREPKKSVGHVKVHGHKVKVSVDESPYAIGAFEPLLDLGRFDKPLDEFGKDWIPDAARKSALLSEKKSPTAASPKPEGAPKQDTTDGVFAANALLGDGYEQRKQAQKDHEKKGILKGGNPATTTAAATAAADDGPFTPGPSLINSSPPSRTSPDVPTSTAQAGSKKPSDPNKPDPPGWFPSALEHSARERSRSTPQKTPPTRPPNLHLLGRPHHPHQHHPLLRPHHRRRMANAPSPLVDLTPPHTPAGWSSPCSSSPATPTSSSSTPSARDRRPGPAHRAHSHHSKVGGGGGGGGGAMLDHHHLATSASTTGGGFRPDRHHDPLVPRPLRTSRGHVRAVVVGSGSGSGSGTAPAMSSSPPPTAAAAGQAAGGAGGGGYGGLISHGPVRRPPDMPPPPVPPVPARAFARGVGGGCGGSGGGGPAAAVGAVGRGRVSSAGGRVSGPRSVSSASERGRDPRPKDGWPLRGGLQAGVAR